jgi:ABC-2 type transport system permease protein
MRKMIVVAVREYRAAVLTKAFLVSILLMPLMMGGSILAQVFLKDVKNLKPKKYAVIDRTPGEQLFPTLQKKMQERNEKETKAAEAGKQKEPIYELVREAPSAKDRPAVLRQRFELSERVRSGELNGFMDIGADVLKEPNLTEQVVQGLGALISGGSRRGRGSREEEDTTKEDMDEEAAKKVKEAAAIAMEPRTVRYYSNNPMARGFQEWAATQIFFAVGGKRADHLIKGDKPEHEKLQEVLSVISPAALQSKELAVKNKYTGEIEDGKDTNFLASFGIPFGASMLMFMIVMVGATPAMQGVVEEKMQRIAEVLLGSVPPFQLMMGKLLGIVGVSLTLAAVYLGGAMWAAGRYGFADSVPTQLIVWFIIFQTLSVFMFGSLFIAIGAACTDMKETQNLMMPVMMLVCLPLFMLANVIQEPESKFATGMSYVPFATPMLMVARMSALPGVPLGWQPYVGMVGVLLTTLVLVYVAGRIFRVGLLMQGKGASLGELARWVFKA